jgi:ABC-type glycerol-3-phosphate transport system substrate-binding protein
MQIRLTHKLLSSMAVAILVMSACTGAAEQDQSEGDDEGAGGGVTLVFSDWHLSEPIWAASLEEAIAQYEEDNPGVEIQTDVVSYAEKETKYATEIEAGQGPDVFHMQYGALLNFMERGYMMDLTQYIEEEGGEEFTSQWYPIVMDQMQFEGKFFALPGDFMAMLMFYNGEMLEEAGLDTENLPETWDEWLEYARTLTGGNQWGFGTVGAIDPGFELRVSPVFYSHGADFLTEDHSCSALNTPEAKKAFDFFVSLVTEEKVVPPGVTQQNPGTVREQVANEQVAMAFGTGWTPPIVDGLNPDLNAFEVLEAAPVPIDPAEDPDQPTSAWLSAWAINPNTEHPDEAWEFLKFLTSTEMEQKWFDDNRVLSSRVDVSGAREGDGPEGYPELINDKFAGVIAQEIPNAQFPPQVPELPQILEAVNSATQQAFTGELSSEEALEQAHDEINELLGGQDCPAF